MNNFLPSYQWQRDIKITNDFNNYLVNGFSQGLSLYGPEQDLKLFNKLNLDAISPDAVNFDTVNKIVNENYSKK